MLVGYSVMPDYHAHGYDNMTDESLMEKVKRGWKSTETPCGTGSTVENSRLARSCLTRLVKRYEIKTVSDAGAGDLNWIRKTSWDVEYQGYDLFPRHPDVIQFDMTKEVLPKTDLILCRHVLNHLSIQFSERAVENFRKSGSTYLLMTNAPNQRDYWKAYDFSIGEPIETFPDCYKWELELYRLESL